MISINKMKRVEDAKEARSNAINRYLSSRDEEIDKLRTDLYIWKGTVVTLLLIIISAGFGLR